MNLKVNFRHNTTTGVVFPNRNPAFSIQITSKPAWEHTQPEARFLRESDQRTKRNTPIYSAEWSYPSSSRHTSTWPGTQKQLYWYGMPSANVPPFHCVYKFVKFLFLTKGPEVRDRFPALPHFLKSSGYGTVSTKPRECNWKAAWKKK
jgi:hypothetical protein